MLELIDDNRNLDKINPLFNDIRFFMGRSVLNSLMGQAYVDDIDNPQIAFLIVRRFCFISGNIDNSKLKELIDNNFKEYILIPNDNICKSIDELYKNKIYKLERYSIKKEVKFDLLKLRQYAQNISKEFTIKRIDDNLEKRIKDENFIAITDDYKKYGIGFCCLNNDKIIGVASSNIFYKDGIEVNIKVKEDYRRKGIATALASKLIIACLEENKKVSWDAANMNSVKLAQKLGFQYDSTYNIYTFSLK